MNLNELKEKYKAIPAEMQRMKHWVGYKVEDRGGKSTKVPYNAITGRMARSDDPSTWSSFNVAINGIIKFGFTGLGFMFGDGIFGVDLDNHPNQDTGEYERTPEEFKKYADEFINQLDSYTEWSMSGKGIHIICQGTLPQGRRRNSNVEMYDKGRFFACTGNVINQKPVMERTEQVLPLWKKYLDDSEERKKNAELRAMSPLGNALGTGNGLTDQQVLEKARNSKNGSEFWALYSGIANMSDYNSGHSGADMAFCSMLAFWCNGDATQMDRIFRSSSLMREKWDSARGSSTYGRDTINKAISTMTNGYKEQTPIVRESIIVNSGISKDLNNAKKDDSYMNIDSNGNPIFRIKKIYKQYPCDDTGNAEMFYDYFGDCFRYNKDEKTFMFWTGKTWEIDTKDIIRKYANKIIEIMREEATRLEDTISEMSRDPEEEDAVKKLCKRLDALEKNIKKVSNKAGKDAMLSELQSIYDIPVRQNDFDRDKSLLNTDSGIVDLKTGLLMSFDKNMMLSKNTQTKVSFDEPKQWIAFLKSVFVRKDEQETKDIINYVQKALGMSLTGENKEQLMFLLWGDGSNGKSTMVELIANILGDYCKKIDPSILMANASASQSTQFALAELVGARMVIAEETNEGDKINAKFIKSIVGSGKINAQRKFGRPFEFEPQFKTWLMTNNRPIIRESDYGTWRRISYVPFEHIFKTEEKDVDMPNKLLNEAPKILGWCIQGAKKLYEEGGRLIKPSCLEIAINSYQNDMRGSITRFLDRFCKTEVGSPFLKTERQELYKAFLSYASSNNEYRMPESKFFKELQERNGFVAQKSDNGDWFYYGIKLNSAGESLVNKRPQIFIKGDE